MTHPISSHDPALHLPPGIDPSHVPPITYMDPHTDRFHRSHAPTRHYTGSFLDRIIRRAKTEIKTIISDVCELPAVIWHKVTGHGPYPKTKQRNLYLEPTGLLSDNPAHLGAPYVSGPNPFLAQEGLLSAKHGSYDF